MNSLSGVQHWGQPVQDVDYVNDGEIGAAEFRAEYVDQCRPLVIRSATQHWPASERWRDPEYIADKLRDVKFGIHREPVIELSWRQRLWPDRFAKVFETHARGVETYVVGYDELMQLIASDEIVFAYSVQIDSTSSLSPLHDDIGDFPVVPRPGRPHYYKPLRAFVHGVSYTDWHCHPDDNTFMCQFGRPKTLYLLPPDQATWDVLFDVAQHEARIGAADPAQYPQLKTLTPRTAIVNPGDAVYIPPNWWHAVECTEVSTLLGITVAKCWASPLHIRSDPRFPYRKIFKRHGRLSHRVQLAVSTLLWRLLDAAGRTLEAIPDATSRRQVFARPPGHRNSDTDA